MERDSIRADLYSYALIGFQPEWQRLQGVEGKNILQLIADRCFSVGLDLCAITSLHFQIPKGSIHDRFRQLMSEVWTLPEEYNTDVIGNNILVVEKGRKRLYIINGQGVISYHNKRRVDFGVVGSNQVPQGQKLEDALKYCIDNGLILIANHTTEREEPRLGPELTEEYIEYFDAIEGFNSNNCLPNWLGRFKSFRDQVKQRNKESVELAKRLGKPWIANSADRSLMMGQSHTRYVGIDLSSESSVLRTLKRSIKDGLTIPFEEYLSQLEAYRLKKIFDKGLKMYPYLAGKEK